jgi:exodeoxyribonuclease VII large subunit
MLNSDIIYSISELNKNVHNLLEQELGWVKVQGEISNLKKASSGHYYLSLKDSNAQVNCVLFSSYALPLAPNLLENGKQVIAYARVGLYQPRGDYQLNIRHVEDAGAGLLQMEFEKLKAKLAELGLFEAQFKQPLPVTPQVVGVVTSPHGAAIRDILATLKRRFIAARIIIYPTDVQGKTAAPRIAQAINIANQRKECDVLIVARGGGSLEDLWPFNEEVVAWAIFNSEIPIVTGIGHQIDTSIADFVADYTASTPTAAAEAVAPNQKDWLLHTQQFLQRAYQTLQYLLNQKKQFIHLWEHKLQQFKYNLQEKSQTVDRLESALKHSLYKQLTQKRNAFNQLQYRLTKKNPRTHIQACQTQFSRLILRLHHLFNQRMQERHRRFSSCISALRVVSPLATLERGYALAMTTEQKLIREPSDVQVNDKILVKLSHMELSCQIIKVKPNV